MLATLLKYFLFLVLIILLLALVILVIDRSIRAKGYQGPASDHFNGEKFLNMKWVSQSEERAGFVRILRWMLTREDNEWEMRSVTQSKPAERIEGSALTVTMINHATVLIQTEGLNIITDPIYSKRASPFSFAGPHRFAEPGVAFDDLPRIDAVLISHNHYDHLDLPTLKRIAERDGAPIFVPLGNGDFLKEHGVANGIELDWWQTNALTETVSITSVPAQHFSARAFSDRDRTLWSGYAVSTPSGAIYFAGDTGYGPFVEKIAERFPNGFRLGLVPIGAFRPAWFMKEVHISPDEAFAIQERLKIQDVVAVHFGTFKLADDRQDEPAERVEELRTTLPESRRFMALPNGGSVEIPVARF